MQRQSGRWLCVLTCVAVAFAAVAIVWPSGGWVTVYPSEQLLVDGLARTYRMVVPRHESGERLPIVFHFHGHGNTPESEADRTRLDHLAASQRFVLVYPAAIQGNWLLSELAGPTAGTENGDIRFFDLLLADLTRRLPIDPTRVYVTGMSMGASFVHELAVARADSITAAVAQSGVAPRRIESDRPIPIMIVTGADEPPTALDLARANARKYRDQGHPCDLVLLHEIGHEWDSRLNMTIWRFLREYRLCGSSGGEEST